MNIKKYFCGFIIACSIIYRHVLGQITENYVITALTKINNAILIPSGMGWDQSIIDPGFPSLCNLLGVTCDNQQAMVTGIYLNRYQLKGIFTNTNKYYHV